MKFHSLVLSANTFAVVLGQAQQAIEITQNVNSSEKSFYSTRLVSKPTTNNLAVSSNVPVSILKCDSSDNHVCPDQDNVIVYLKSVCDDPEDVLSNPVVVFSAGSIPGEARLSIDMNQIPLEVQDLLPVSTFATSYEAMDTTCVSRCSQQEEQEQGRRKATEDSEPVTGDGSTFNQNPDPAQEGDGDGPKTGGGLYVTGNSAPETGSAQMEGSEPVTGGGSTVDEDPNAAQEGNGEPQTGGGLYQGESTQANPAPETGSAMGQAPEPQTGDGSFWNPNPDPLNEGDGPQTGGGSYFQGDTNEATNAAPETGGGMHGGSGTSGGMHNSNGDGMGTSLGGDMAEPTTGNGSFYGGGLAPGPVFFFSSSSDQGPGVPTDTLDPEDTAPAVGNSLHGNIEDISIEDLGLLSLTVTQGEGTGNQLGTNLDLTDQQVIYLPEETREDCENNGRKVKAVMAKGIFKNLRTKMEQKQCQVTAEILVNVANKIITVTAPMLQVYDNVNISEVSVKLGGEDNCMSKCVDTKHVTMTYPDDAITIITDDVDSYVI